MYNKNTNLETEKWLSGAGDLRCVVHGEQSKHKLKNCNTFKDKSIGEKKRNNSEEWDMFKVFEW